MDACVLEDDSSVWIVDSGSTNHVCISLQLLSNWKTVKEGELKLRVGNGEFVEVKAKGQARLNFGNKFMLLDDVYFIPNFSRNLVSVSLLHQQRFAVTFTSFNISISFNGCELCVGCMENGLYILRPNESLALNNELFKVANPRTAKR